MPPLTTTATSSSSTSSSRWCPTPEQLMILEEMYRTGVRTPNASQIQQITAHLSLYGKIEGKNVFYWFQNHKARDRQKLRRRLSKQLHHQFYFQQQPQHPHQQRQQQQRILNQHSFSSNSFFQYINASSPSHSSGSADLYHCPCCSPNSFLQGVMRGSTSSPQNIISNKWLMRGATFDDSDGADRTAVMKICGSLDRSLAMDVDCSCFHYLPRPLKTLDLFPTTATNLREECSLQQSV